MFQYFKSSPIKRLLSFICFFSSLHFIYGQPPIGYNYVMPIAIFNPNPTALSDFQVSFDLQTDVLVSSNKIKANASDILFQHGCKNLCFWIEDSSFNAARTTFWIKVDNINPGIDTVYMYYGNASATTNTFLNGDCTFEFFDDFNYGTLDTIKWPKKVQKNGGEFFTVLPTTTTSGVFTYTANASTNRRAGLYHPMSMADYEVGAKMKIDYHPYNGFIPDCDPEIGWLNSSIDTRILTYVAYDEVPEEYITVPGNITKYNTTTDLRGEWNYMRVRTLSNQGQVRRFTYAPFYSTNLIGNYTSPVVNYTITGTPAVFIGTMAHGGLQSYYDFVFVRKAVANEPSLQLTPERNNIPPCILSLSSNSPVCEQQNIVLNFNNNCAANNSSYTIIGPSGFIATSNQHQYTIPFALQTNNGMHFVIDTIQSCEYKDSTNVIINLLPSIVASPGSTCIGSQATVSASGAVNYIWSNGHSGTGITVSPISNTSYTVIGSDANGCTNITTTTVTVNLPPVVTIQYNSICEGVASEISAHGAAMNYEWNINGVNYYGSTVNTILFSSTSVSVTATDSNGCSSSIEQNIIVNPKPIIDFEIQITDSLCSVSGFATNTSPVIEQSTWFFNYQPAGNSSNFNFELLGPGKNSVQLVSTTSFGCSDTLEKFISIHNDFYSALFLPNTFTPNRDGINDTWGISNSVCTSEIRLHIYNRWGTLLKVLDANDPQWDATFNGITVEDGIYVYKLFSKSALDGSEKERLGHVSVLK